MGFFGSKNDTDNRNYDDGYKTGRGSQDPASYVADSLFRGFYGEQWNAGYTQGQADADEHGKRD